MEDQDYIVFDHYLQGELSKAERTAFELRLVNETDFKNNFETYKDLCRFLEHKFDNESENDAFKANLETIAQGHFNTLKPSNKIQPKKKQFTVFKYAIAAAVALLIGITTFNKLSVPTYGDYNNYEAISLSVRADDAAVLKDAERAFNARDYEGAIPLFNKLLIIDNSNLEVVLYKGIALIETNRFKDAELLLLKISKTQSAYKQDALWYLALNKLKQKDNASCISVLKQIEDNTEHFEAAQKLLNKLK